MSELRGHDDIELCVRSETMASAYERDLVLKNNQKLLLMILGRWRPYIS